eukprot:TRINITY_DN534_c0_g1_i4.p1 TRINITY_DN534_c0_g1~~TRINITY_DN534_c0_g1_i4.p1  ORF type:complete len:180 (+),score=27.68 TRINITY_DN534_c0_g1_i4:36-575(+)
MSSLTQEEAERYDRQIRLWGLTAQKRMGSSEVLLICLKGSNAEVCKNLVLAGVGTISIYDPEPVQWSDLGSQFFITEQDIGKNRAEASRQNISALNPSVKINILTEDPLLLPDHAFRFSVVCLTSSDPSYMLKIDDVCRRNHIPLYINSIFGQYTSIFTDLNGHAFTEEISTENHTTNS